MKRRFALSLFIAGIMVCLEVSSAAAEGHPAYSGIALPRSFVLNEGQWDAPVRAASFGPGSTISFGREGYRVALRNGIGTGVAEAFVTPWPGMRLRGISPGCRMQGIGIQAPQLRYIGGQGERSVTHMLDRYMILRYAAAWKGVDVDISGTGATLRHTLRVAAGADPSHIALRFDHVTKDGLAASVQGSAGHRVRLVARDGGVDVSIGGPHTAAAFTVTLDYNYYWGGSNSEWAGASRVDRAGDLHVLGMTLSANFPLVPAGTPPDGIRSAAFVSVLSADGRSVRYSTVLDQAAVAWVSNLHHIAIGKHDWAILNLQANEAARLLTPDAQFKPRWESAAVMLVLDNTGAVVYGTATPDSGRIFFNDMETGGDGAIYAVSMVGASIPTMNKPLDFLTPDAYQSTLQGNGDGVIMKFDADTYQLTYATIFGGTGTDNLQSIAVDGCGSVAVGGYNSGGGYPLVNAVQQQNAGGMDLVFTRFSKDFRRIVYSTYLGGIHADEMWGYQIGYGWQSSRRIRYDPDGNLYFTANSTSPDFPQLHPLQSKPGGLTDLVLGKFSPTGELRFSSYFGGSHHEYNGSIDVDACGNMILCGASASSDLPQLHPMVDSGFVFFSVIDTRQSALRFSSWLANNGANLPSYWWYGGNLTLDGTAVYFAEATYRGFAPPPTPGYPNGGGNDSVDVQILRFDMPELCSRKVFQDRSTENGGLSAVPLGIDTLRIDLDRGTHTPPIVVVSCRVKNQSLLLPSDSVAVTLLIPGTMLQPASGSPPLRQVLAPLGPGDSVDVAWQLRPLVDSIIPISSLPISVFFATGGECPSGDGFDQEIPVRYSSVPDAEFRCDLFLAPAFALKPDTTRLEHDSMLVTLRIENISETRGLLRLAILRMLDGSGVTFLAPTDSVVVPPPLPGKSHVELHWLIGVKSWPFGRPLRFEAVLVDTFGLVVARCMLDDDIPGTFGSRCALNVSTPVRVRADDSSFVPDPVIAIAVIHNLSDTLRPYRDLRLDLSSSKHIKPSQGESLHRPDFTIEEDSSRDFTWLLRISPPPNQTVTETVRMIYRTNADTTERSCNADVRIILLASDVECSIECPDTLLLDGYAARYVPDTLRISAVVRNSGGLAQDIESVRLTVEPAGAVKLIDPIAQGLPQLRPGKADTVVWNLVVPVLPVPRNIRFTVSVTAPGGGVLTSCERGTQAPALPVNCLMAAPDTIRYDEASGSYDPADFEIVGLLVNQSDTSYTNLRAVLDDGLLQRVALAPGESAELQRAELRPGEYWDARWRLVPRWGDRAFAQRLRVRFFFDPAALSTLCETESLIEGAPRNAELRCATAGHDSVWADSYYEALIPDPVQVQYTVRNTGNVASAPCALAIIPPLMLELADGEDSVRTVPVLMPGESFAAEWLLRILPDRITAAPWIVRWQSDCEELAAGPACEHTMAFITGAPAGVVLTPWLLRFSAERDGPLPAEQDVRLWTGGGVSPTWQMTSRPPWLDAAPASGAGRMTMRVVPNSTALAVGVHADVVTIDPFPLSSGDIQVIYDIHTKLAAEEPVASASLSIGAMYPNPASTGNEVRVLLRADAGAAVRVELRDMLGRLRYRAEAAGGAGEGEIVRIPTTGIPSGTYLLTARAAGDSVSRLLLVLP